MNRGRRPASNINVARAVRSWARRQSGEWSTADQVELDRWLASSEEHVRAYAHVQRTWVELGDLAPDESPLVPEQPARAWRWKAGGIAAAVLLSGMTVWWFVRPSPKPRQLVSTSLPQVFQLEDGTKISVDASSEVTTQMIGPNRRVDLRRGEALIESHSTGRRRLEVWAGAGRIVDVGTRFDVEFLHGSVRVAVYEGRVAVGTSRGAVDIGAGMAGGYTSSGDLLPLHKAGTEATLAADGLRHFDAVPLEDVAERLQRYHAIRIDFGDSAARALLVSGTFRLTELDEILATLAKALPVEIIHPAADRILVKSRAPS